MRAYYNEIDPYCCAWLRNLIAEGFIAAGDVDERSILDVQPDDLRGYTQAHFFAGLGGWSYALRIAGWPDDRPVWTGSCPCQPFSAAGKREGFADERHLWPAWVSLIKERRPAAVFGEQVASATDWLRLVLCDLDALGYAVGAMPIEAASAGADHLRDRYWFVAHGAGIGSGAGLREGEQEDGHGAPGRGGMEHAERGPAQRRRGAGVLPGTPGQVEGQGYQRQRSGDAIADPGEGSSTLGDTSSPRLSPSEQQGIRGSGRRDEGRAATEPSGARDMADADRGRQQIERESEHSNEQGASGHEFDGCSEERSGKGTAWVIGSDDKARRVKPGVRLLAHGVPARVPKLRAFGNAIDPRPAAEFIKAAM